MSDSDFGVPFPGSVLPADRRVNALLRRLPRAGEPFDWVAAFGRSALPPDNPYYWRHTETTVPVLFDWRRHEGPWPDAPAGRTRREIIAQSRGLKVFRGEGRPRKDLPAAEVAAILARLPEPAFD